MCSPCSPFQLSSRPRHRGPENLGAVSQTVQVKVAPAPAAALTPQTLTTPTPKQ
jgi:hypothetical protein